MSLSDIVRRLILPKAVPEPEQLRDAHAGDTMPVTFLRTPRAPAAPRCASMPARRRIVLTAPLRMGRGTAVDFAQAQAGWIAARLKRLPELKPFVDGAEVPLFGQAHRIRHRADRRGTVWREGFEIHVAGRPEHLPRRLRDWLTAEPKARLVPMVHAKALRVERPVKRITVRDSRSRWGSCGPDATMSFSWRLVFRAARGAGLSGRARGRPSRASQSRPPLLGPRPHALRRADRGPADLAQEKRRGPAAVRRVIMFFRTASVPLAHDHERAGRSRSGRPERPFIFSFQEKLQVRQE